ncbi:MAG: phytanoyl-CoA dioxygenase family protein [Planctomycetota bacterium]|nr:phytanoyl-CoA dioxygenase family protein [Planctomycetota bacterium]MDA1143214.1 phytanoyl-CoA dioxygenase family protein [Planctomycetota bacterium]
MNYYQQFAETGYVLLPAALPESLLAGLREAGEILFREIEEGKNQAARHQTVLKPDVFHPSYLAFLNLPELNETAMEILACDDLAFPGLACLLGNRHHSLCKWHRDFPDTDPELIELLGSPNCCIQLNCAVYPDECLWIIPGSHCRRTKPAESEYAGKLNELQFIDDWDKVMAAEPSAPSGMPGAFNAKLGAGDCLLYNPFLWHAAVYRPEWKRMTLHGGYRIPANIDTYFCQRWGLPHNPWLQDPDYLGDTGTYFTPQLKHFQFYARKYPKGPAKG